MIALTEERKRQIIDEEPGGLWLVLNEESQRDFSAAGDLLCKDLDVTAAEPRKRA
jgi:hypothetical protein